MSLKAALSFITASTTDQHLSEAKIDFSGGSSIIISGVTGQAIYVYKYFIVVSAATNVTFFDGATALTGPIPLAANEAIVKTFDTRPWYSLSTGQDFIISNSGGAQVSGRAYYIQMVP